MPAGPAAARVATASLSGSVSFTVGDPDQPTVPRPSRAGFMRSGFLSSSKSLRSCSRSLALRLPPVAWSPPFRATTPVRVPALFAASPSTSTPRYLLPGPSPLSRPGCGGSHSSASFRPRVFATSRRLAPSSVSRACFIPQPRPGFRLFRRSGASPIPQRFLARHQSRPPCRCSAHAHRRTGCHVLGARLRGFLPRGDAFFRGGGWPSLPSLPSSASSSLGSSLHHREPGSPDHPLVTLPPRSSSCRPVPGGGRGQGLGQLGSSSASSRWPRWRLASPRRRPVRGLEPSVTV